MKKIYHLKSFYKIAYGFNCVMVLLFIFLKVQNSLFPMMPQWPWDLFLLCYILIGINFGYDLFFCKLIISESGIEYQTFILNLFATWDQVDDLPEKFNFKILFLKKARKTRRIPIPRLEREAIPLYLFADNPLNSELGQQIKQYAPRLFSSVEN